MKQKEETGIGFRKPETEIGTRNRKFYLFRYSKIVVFRTDCVMDLVEFPHDRQVCLFKLGSFSYQSRLVSFELSGDTELDRLRSQPKGYRIDLRPLSPEEMLLSWVQQGVLANYTYAGFKVEIRRHLAPYVFNYYLPTASFVVVSWVNFLIPSTGKMLVGRLGILVTMFLVLINIFLNAKSLNNTSNQPTYLEVQHYHDV